MSVIVAKTAGFCFGVKRAVDQVYEQLKRTDKPIYTFGPIIHNEEVVRDLENKGVTVINSEEELNDIKDSIVVIRSHGVGRSIYEALKRNGNEIIDATCPYVRKIHKIAEKQNQEGRRLIIIGNETHPEVQGIKGWGDENKFASEVEDKLSVPKEITKKHLQKNDPFQSTFHYRTVKKHMVESGTELE